MYILLVHLHQYCDVKVKVALKEVFKIEVWKSMDLAWNPELCILHLAKPE